MEAVFLPDDAAPFQARRFHIVLQMPVIRRMQFEQAQFVGFPRFRLRQPRRTAIQAGLRQHGLQACAEGRKRVGQFFRRCQAGDAVAVFAHFLRFAAQQVVQTRTGVGVDVPIGFVFAVEVIQHQPKDKMFEHVGMVAGVKGVSVAEHGEKAV